MRLTLGVGVVCERCSGCFLLFAVAISCVMFGFRGLQGEFWMCCGIWHCIRECLHGLNLCFVRKYVFLASHVVLFRHMLFLCFA